MRFVLTVIRPAAVLLTGVLLSCATQRSTMPTAQELERYQERFRQTARPQFDDLERRRAAGQLSDEQYASEKSMLEDYVHDLAVSAAWRKHALAESDRKSLGLPTPDRPQEPPVMQSGATGGFYQPYNQQYGGQTTVNPLSPSGYTPGGNVMGNRGRSF